MHVLEDEETGDQTGRQRWLAGACRADRGEASFQKAPVDLLRQPDQRVTHVDDPLQGRPEQILLPLIARLRHRFPRAISARSGNHDPPQIGIANCKKPQPNPAFPAKSITRSTHLVPLSQRYPNSSRATNHDPPQIGIANCKKPQPNPAFPAKSITRSSQLSPLSQRYPNSSHGVIADGC